jgi:hypothetical protein
VGSSVFFYVFPFIFKFSLVENEVGEIFDDVLMCTVLHVFDDGLWDFKVG